MRIIDYIHQGGVIMYLLLLLNIIGVAVMISKFLLYSGQRKRIDEVAKEIGDGLKSKHQAKDPQAMIELAKQELSNHLTRMERGLNTVKIIATISPLLGLLGTVIGVLIAFQVMSQTGLNNPASFAQGISMALITTVGGMIVAIPHFIGHNYLLGMLDGLEAELERDVLGYIL